ncbi:RagB/SusD family nutrient uptake outer membrane protein [Bacteroidota bacterium]
MKNITRNLKNLIWISIVLYLCTIGCVSLDEEPMDFPAPENFYSTEGQIVSALTGSMAQLYSQWGNYSYPWGAYHTDYDRESDLVFSASHNNWIWQGHYSAIAILNSVIKALNEDKADVTVEKKDELMAQAKFLRAFNYFMLVRGYGDVPIITEETDVVNGEIKRAPILQVYDLIIADLTVALADLPEAWDDDLAGRPSRDAARGYLAKVYLTMASAPVKDASKASLARDMAKAIMDNGEHYLVSDIFEVFAIENKLGPEFIFSFNSTPDDIATPPQIWLPGTMAFGWGDFGLNNVWTDAYPEQPRKEAYMILEDWDGTSYLDYNWNGAPSLRKYVYNDRADMESLRSWPNIPLLRYADVLMMYAEAENMVNSGPTQAAVDAVNLVINRANAGAANPNHQRATISMSQAEFDAKVIQERCWELFWEYDRWYDLVRKEILCDVWAGRPGVEANCDPDDYLWPIPQTDLRLNPLMTQNPGYVTPDE